MSQENRICPQQRECASCPVDACDEHLYNSYWSRSKCHKGLSRSWVWIHTCVTEQSGRKWTRQRWTLVSGLLRAEFPICTRSSGEASVAESSTNELQSKYFAFWIHRTRNQPPHWNPLKTEGQIETHQSQFEDEDRLTQLTLKSILYGTVTGALHTWEFEFLTDRARFDLVLIHGKSR